jgi:hypothetical protein
VTFQADSQIPAPRVPLTDERTGFVSREWFRFFNLLYNATGTVSRVRGTGSTNGISLTGDVTTSGFLRFGKARCVLPPEAAVTGLNVAPADGQLLIGSDGNYFLNTLQPGPGMLVTNAPATITLAPGGAPVTKQLIFDLAADEFNVINNKTGSACVVTLPAASDWVGRTVNFKNTQAQALDSASSNVVPITGGAAGTAILGATSGAWAVVVSDGTNWVIMATG